jgi:hypothetical protein
MRRLRAEPKAVLTPPRFAEEMVRGFKIPVRWAAPVGCAGFDAGLEVHARAGYQIALGFATH